MNQEWKYLIALSRVRGIGEVLIKNLFSRFGSAKEIFAASKKDLRQVQGISERHIEAIKSFSDWPDVEEELNKIDKHKVRLLSLKDSEYPESLSQIYNPPSFVYITGEILRSDKNSIAIVGTRLPNKYGRKVTEALAGELASMGITVVSGLARGVDSIAQAEALKRGGRTIGVLGCGLDVVYPPENVKLYKQVSENGAVVSEFGLGTPPISHNFPQRNRIISGISLGVIVVQASEKSGSLISASFALDQNKEVFAVPGNIDNKLSRGSNWLIKKGAKLVETVDDVLLEFEAFANLKSSGLFEEERTQKVLDKLSQNQKEVYSVLSSEPQHIDDIHKKTGIESANLLSILLTLELNDYVQQLPGKIFQIK